MVEAIAPLRIEVGTFLDQLGVATLHDREGLHTATIAIGMYTRLRIAPILGDVVRIRAGEVQEEFTHPLPLDSRFGIVNACLTHFDITGADITLNFEAPTHCGLGGSSILMTLLCASLLSAEQPELSDSEIKLRAAKISVMLENGLFAPTGYQDQLSSIYGGVQLFHWKVLEAIPFMREELLPEAFHEELSSRLLVAFAGERHSSADATELMMRSFKRGGDERKKWLKTNTFTVAFAAALKERNWNDAIAAINQANELRCELVPTVLSGRVAALRQVCQAHAAGFGLAGAGAGGCAFSLSSTTEASQTLEQEWRRLITQFGEGDVWRPGISGGMQVHRIEDSCSQS